MHSNFFQLLKNLTKKEIKLLISSGEDSFSEKENEYLKKIINQEHFYVKGKQLNQHIDSKLKFDLFEKSIGRLAFQHNYTSALSVNEWLEIIKIHYLLDKGLFKIAHKRLIRLKKQAERDELFNIIEECLSIEFYHCEIFYPEESFADSYYRIDEENQNLTRKKADINKGRVLLTYVYELCMTVDQNKNKILSEKIEKHPVFQENYETLSFRGFFLKYFCKAEYAYTIGHIQESARLFHTLIIEGKENHYCKTRNPHSINQVISMYASCSFKLMEYDKITWALDQFLVSNLTFLAKLYATCYRLKYSFCINLKEGNWEKLSAIMDEIASFIQINKKHIDDLYALQFHSFLSIGYFIENKEAEFQQSMSYVHQHFGIHCRQDMILEILLLEFIYKIDKGYRFDSLKASYDQLYYRFSKISEDALSAKIFLRLLQLLYREKKQVDINYLDIIRQLKKEFGEDTYRKEIEASVFCYHEWLISKATNRTIKKVIEHRCNEETSKEPA